MTEDQRLDANLRLTALTRQSIAGLLTGIVHTLRTPYLIVIAACVWALQDLISAYLVEAHKQHVFDEAQHEVRRLIAILPEEFEARVVVIRDHAATEQDRPVQPAAKARYN